MAINTTNYDWNTRFNPSPYKTKRSSIIDSLYINWGKRKRKNQTWQIGASQSLECLPSPPHGTFCRLPQVIKALIFFFWGANFLFLNKISKTYKK
jgi:hypothetical protein